MKKKKSLSPSLREHFFPLGLLCASFGPGFPASAFDLTHISPGNPVKTYLRSCNSAQNPLVPLHFTLSKSWNPYKSLYTLK